MVLQMGLRVPLLGVDEVWSTTFSACCVRQEQGKSLTGELARITDEEDRGIVPDLNTRETIR